MIARNKRSVSCRRQNVSAPRQAEIAGIRAVFTFLTVQFYADGPSTPISAIRTATYWNSWRQMEPQPRDVSGSTDWRTTYRNGALCGADTTRSEIVPVPPGRRWLASDSTREAGDHQSANASRQPFRRRPTITELGRHSG